MFILHTIIKSETRLWYEKYFIWVVLLLAYILQKAHRTKHTIRDTVKTLTLSLYFRLKSTLITVTQAHNTPQWQYTIYTCDNYQR